MRRHRFYIDGEIQAGNIIIKSDELLNQWRNVFRYNVGSEVVIFCGDGFEYRALIGKISNREAELKILDKRAGIKLTNEIVLYQSLIKKDNFEWVVEKATELGVTKIVPIISEHSEKKNLNLERLQKIAIEASEQCGRATITEISKIKELSEVLTEVSNPIVFDLSGTPPPSPLPKGEGAPTSVFIGPEGGWSPHEIELFKAKGAQIYNLGPLTLRAETATIAALASLEINRN